MEPLFRVLSAPPAVQDKGSQIFKRILLLQYQDSHNLKEFITAFIAEMDILFSELDKVYTGRFLTEAVGSNLDVVGILLDEDRAVDLPITFFGFKGEGEPIPINTGPFADINNPNDGGVFRSEEQDTAYSSYALSDVEFRKLLMAKAMLLSSDDLGIDTVYAVISTLIGRVPRTMTIETTSPRQVELKIANEDTTEFDKAIIQFFTKYLAPLGTTFTVTRV